MVGGCWGLLALYDIGKYTVDICFSPVSPGSMDWGALYPAFFTPQSGTATDSNSHQEVQECSKGHQVEFADIGCGYGGLLGEFITVD